MNDTITNARDTISNSGVAEWEWDFNNVDNEKVLEKLAQFYFRHDSEEFTDEVIKDFLTDNNKNISDFY